MFCGQMKEKYNFLAMHTNSLLTGNEAHKKENTLQELSMMEDPIMSGTGGFHCITEILKSDHYQDILEQCALPSVRKLDLNRRSGIFHQDKDPKHTSKSTQMVKKEKNYSFGQQ